MYFFNSVIPNLGWERQDIAGVSNHDGDKKIVLNYLLKHGKKMKN